MKDYKLNTYIEWTKEDRTRGECPVPDGSDVTVWFQGGDVDRDELPQAWDWGEAESERFADNAIVGYMIHSVPREPREWYVAKRDDGQSFFLECRQDAVDYITLLINPEGWEIIKVREVMEEDA